MKNEGIKRTETYTENKAACYRLPNTTTMENLSMQVSAGEGAVLKISNRNIQISIDNLTAMMTGAKGGYKLTEYDEDGRWLRDLYMDTPDKTTAKRIMQINKDGIAASTSGYEGPYTVGITVDGQILGSWIAANSIDTNQLSIGLNKPWPPRRTPRMNPSMPPGTRSLPCPPPRICSRVFPIWNCCSPGRWMGPSWKTASLYSHYRAVPSVYPLFRWPHI